VNIAFLGLAKIEDCAGTLAVNENSSFRCLGTPLLLWPSGIALQRARLLYGRSPAMTGLVRRAGAFPFFSSMVSLELYESFHFRSVAFPVRANG